MTEAVAAKEGRVTLGEDQALGVQSAHDAMAANERAFREAEARAKQILAGPSQALQASRARYTDLCRTILRVNGEPVPDDGGDYLVGAEPGEDGAPVAVLWRLREEPEHGESD